MWGRDPSAEVGFGFIGFPAGTTAADLVGCLGSSGSVPAARPQRFQYKDGIGILEDAAIRERPGTSRTAFADPAAYVPTPTAVRPTAAVLRAGCTTAGDLESPCATGDLAAGRDAAVAGLWDDHHRDRDVADVHRIPFR
jgi:hypothetical protein